MDAMSVDLSLKYKILSDAKESVARIQELAAHTVRLRKQILETNNPSISEYPLNLVEYLKIGEILHKYRNLEGVDVLDYFGLLESQDLMQLLHLLKIEELDESESFDKIIDFLNNWGVGVYKLYSNAIGGING